MACPYFYPSVLRGQSGPQSSMLPLGDSWNGECRADSAGSQTPDPASVASLCNLGYARGLCARFPGGDGPDAVRFTVRRDDGSAVGLHYVIERDHHPHSHGPLDFSRSSDTFAAPLEPATLQRQAQAYVAAYLRRKAEAS